MLDKSQGREDGAKLVALAREATLAAEALLADATRWHPLLTPASLRAVVHPQAGIRGVERLVVVFASWRGFAVVALLAVVATGCTRTRYRLNADRQGRELIDDGRRGGEPVLHLGRYLGLGRGCRRLRRPGVLDVAHLCASPLHDSRTLGSRARTRE